MFIIAWGFTFCILLHHEVYAILKVKPLNIKFKHNNDIAYNNIMQPLVENNTFFLAFYFCKEQKFIVK
jgi:hypothetical protein